MAHLCMNVAWGKQSGIGVDVHVHRLDTERCDLRARIVPAFLGICAMLYFYNISIPLSLSWCLWRISARLGWTKDCKEPEQTRQSLEAWLPEDRWNIAVIINIIIAGGQVKHSYCHNRGIPPLLAVAYFVQAQKMQNFALFRHEFTHFLANFTQA